MAKFGPKQLANAEDEALNIYLWASKLHTILYDAEQDPHLDYNMAEVEQLASVIAEVSLRLKKTTAKVAAKS